MIGKNIFIIVPNKTIGKYILGLLNNFDGKIKLVENLNNLINEIDEFKPACILIFYQLKVSNKDVYTMIKNESLFYDIPILLLSFYSIPFNILETDKNVSYLKLPTSNEQFLLEVDKAMFTRKYVLMVDDSALIHKQITKILKDNNFGVFSAYNGKEAIEILRVKKPDIIITDIEMPVMNGYEFCKEVKNNPDTENIPVIIQSSLSSGIDIDRGFDAGANDYLTKPVDVEELLNRINGILSKENHFIREKILVVDDSKVIRNMMIQGFEQQGFQVFYGANGKEGLEKANEIEPDLITTDYDMPIMNGWEFCQALRKNKKLKNIPVIMLTSRDSKSDRAKTSGAGVKSYLTKPFTVDKLLTVVERILAEKRSEREREILKFYVSDAAFEAARAGAREAGAVTKMRAKEIFATVLFTDIASFTPTCEKLTPKQLITLLNEYFDLMCSILKKHNAIIDKFIGDAILAVFGQGESGVYNAVSAGVEMVQSLQEFNKGRETPLHMRVGINSGKLYIGDIGSTLHRRDFTVIGDNVNVGQRLESKCRVDGVLISDSAYNIVKDCIEAEQIGPIALKGKKEEVYAYQVLNVKNKE